MNNTLPTPKEVAYQPISDPAGVVFMGVHLPRVTGACGVLTRGWLMMRLWRHIPGGDTGIGRRPIRNTDTTYTTRRRGGIRPEAGTSF